MIEHSEELCGGDIVREARQRWADDTIAFVNAEPEPLSPWAREARHGAFIVRDLLKQSAPPLPVTPGECNCWNKAPTIPTCRGANAHLDDCPAKDSGLPVGVNWQRQTSRFCSSQAVINKRPHVCELYAGHLGDHECRLHAVAWQGAPESVPA